MDLGLRDKIILVTGGAKGIGAATVEAFSAEDCRVVLVDRDTAYWRTFDWLLLTLSLLHGTNGLRVVLHDNLSDLTIRKLALSALYGTSLIFFILGTYVIIAFVRQS